MSAFDSAGGLRPRSPAMAMSADEFREVGHRLVEDIARLLETLPERPVGRDLTPQEMRAKLPAGGLPEHGTGAAELLPQAAQLLIEHSLFNGHPRFLGYVTSSPAPIGALADLLAASVNANVGSFQTAPAATEIEHQCVRWIAELLGFAGDGLLVSGGNMANFVCFLAARRARASFALRQQGLGGEPARMLVYASHETHTWLHKAADLFGHGTDSIRWIPVDRDLRIDVAALRRRIDADRGAGHAPFLLVGNAGTVGTGAVDPLPVLAEVAREHGLWFHVDGAYGAFAAAVPDAPADLAGLRLADSIAVDPHKWLYAPLEAGCALVRDLDVLRDAFSYKPSYYSFTGEDTDPPVNYYELGLQNSRGFRALKVWLGLRQAGRAGCVSAMAEDMALSRLLCREVAATPRLQAVSQSLSITTFRYVPADLDPGDERVAAYLDALNEALLGALRRSGEVFLSNAVVDGAFVLRACVVNFRTTPADIRAIPGIVVRHGHTIDLAMRPRALGGAATL